MHLLLDILFAPGPDWPERLHSLLLSTPGIRLAEVFAEVGQAEVELQDFAGVSPDEIALRLEHAGFGVRVNQVSTEQVTSDYARYFSAPRDSAESRWVD